MSEDTALLGRRQDHAYLLRKLLEFPPHTDQFDVLATGRFLPGHRGTYAAVVALIERDSVFGHDHRFGLVELVYREQATPRWMAQGGEYDLTFEQALEGLHER
jgi:hypothetical protein